MATESTAPAAVAAPTGPIRRPDEALFKEQEAKLDKEVRALQDKIKAVNNQIDLAAPRKDQEPQNPTQIRRQELIKRLNEIKEQQGGGKKDRASKFDQIKRHEETVKRLINESKADRAKLPVKNLEELEEKIARLERDVNSGMMKLVDEKKALNEISNLRKQKKLFGGFEQQQKLIDEHKAKIKEIKDSLDTPEAKKLSEEYATLQAELDVIKAEQNTARDNLGKLRDERTKLKIERDAKYAELRALRDEYFTQKKAAAAYEREQKAKRAEREAAEREKYAKEKRMERAKAMLAEASEPAFLEEIRRANSLLHFFDPSHQTVEKAPLVANKGLGATDIRKVEADGLKGVRLVRKEDRDEDYLPAAKKGKKGKKNKAAEGGVAASGKFSLPPAVMDDCKTLGINLPSGAADVPAAIEAIKAKLANWKANQEAETKKNVEKAKKEIERLEAEERGEAVSNGEAKEDKAVAETTKAVEDVSLEEKKADEPAKAEEVETVA
ncbi:Putative protein similar to Nuclear segregation protein BFR1 of Saccharomyces cerevisiae [Podospora comata]|uniref:Nuclear segregation protein n=1 Tax=Podospora comata TaxID=48703 RepID=A0ABY6S632_PODCO|nr:Putative protein similar to Nuclear segregation protein BFR1 of Saccharomyces cerevisiae [Podospora comata]